MVRKIKRKQKDNRRAKVLISLFIVFIMVSSIFGFLIGFTGGSFSGQQRFEDYGIVFTQVVENNQPFFEARINGVTYEFIYLPSQVTSVAVDAQTMQTLFSPLHAITFTPPEQPTGLLNFVSNTIASDSARQGQTVQLGVTQRQPSTGLFADVTVDETPQITCEDASDTQTVLHLFYANQTSITVEENCILAQAVTPSDMLIIGEYIRYARLGVFNN